MFCYYLDSLMEMDQYGYAFVHFLGVSTDFITPPIGPLFHIHVSIDC